MSNAAVPALPLTSWPALLQAVSPLLGVELSPDAEGFVAVVVDAQCTVNIQCTDDGRHATLFSSLGRMDAHALQQHAATLLAANFFWHGTHGATLGRDPVSGEVVLAQACALDSLISEGSEHATQACMRLLQGFADVTLAWQQQLAAEAVSPPVDEPPPSASLLFNHA